MLPKWAVGIVITVWVAAQSVGNDRLITLDGMSFETTVVAIDSDGLVHTTDRDIAIGLQGLRRIVRPIKVREPTDIVAVVELVDGSVLKARHVSIREGHCTIAWLMASPLTLPLSSVRAIQFAADSRSPDDDTPRLSLTDNGMDRALAAASMGNDCLLVKEQSMTTTIEGVLDELTEQEVTFIWGGKPRTVTRDKISAVVLAHSSDVPNLTGWCNVHFDDGSKIWSQTFELNDGGLKAEMGNGVEVRTPFDRVIELRIRSDRMAFLSDLVPINVIEQALVTYVMPWRRDRNVQGGPLVLDGIAYKKGIGVHARCLLTFKVDGQYDLFAATIGVDDATSGRGDCVFVVLGDGQELFRKRMRGTDAPETLSVKIREVSQLGLQVEPGEDLDLADHADWCDARLIRH